MRKLILIPPFDRGDKPVLILVTILGRSWAQSVETAGISEQALRGNEPKMKLSSSPFGKLLKIDPLLTLKYKTRMRTGEY